MNNDETTTIRHDAPQPSERFSHPTDAMRSGSHATNRDALSNGPQRSTQRSLMHPREAVASLGDYIEIPFVHWRLIATCFVTGILLGWAALVVLPRSYESEAKLMIKVGRESVALDPTATTSQTLLLQKTQEEEVNSALEVLTSRKVSEQVVEKLGIEAILDGILPGSDIANQPARQESWMKRFAGWAASKARGAVDRTLLISGIKDQISDRERAVRRIEDSLSIHAPKKTTVVTIHGEAESPKLAQAMVAAVTESFLEQHRNVSRTDGSQDFFLTQSKQIEQQLNELVDQRSQFMRENKIVSVDDNRRILTEQLGATERELFLTRGEMEQVAAEIDDLTDKALITPGEIVATKEQLTDQTWSGMRQRVYELEIQEKQYSTMYKPGNPKLDRVQEQLVGARGILEKLQSERVNRSTTPNPSRVHIEDELQRLQTKIVGLRSMVTEKEKQRNEIDRQVDDLLNFDLAITEMNRNISVLERSLGLLKNKLEEARVIDELQSDRISNINTFQAATLVERPVSPKKPILAIAFPMLGLFTGLGLALLRETGNPLLRTVCHVESKLGFPVVSAIPHSSKLTQLKTFVADGESDLLRSECKSILSDMLFSGNGSQVRGVTLGVFGVEDGCGASTIASALALTSSSDCSLRTTLIDADARERSVSSAFELNGAPGFVDLLCGEAEQRECIQQVNRRRLELISASSPKFDRSLDADTRVFESILADFQQDNDLVIVDLPPADRPDQTIAVAQHLDYLLIVVESEKTNEIKAKRLLRRLSGGKAKVIGIVLNKTRSHLPQVINRFIG